MAPLALVVLVVRVLQATFRVAALLMAGAVVVRVHHLLAQAVQAAAVQAVQQREQQAKQIRAAVVAADLILEMQQAVPAAQV